MTVKRYLNLLFFKHGKMYDIEFKRQDAFVITPSIKQVLKDLPLKHIAIVYPGKKRYPFSKRVSVVPFKALFSKGGERMLYGDMVW